MIPSFFAVRINGVVVIKFPSSSSLNALADLKVPESVKYLVSELTTAFKPLGRFFHDHVIGPGVAVITNASPDDANADQTSSLPAVTVTVLSESVVCL